MQNELFELVKSITSHELKKKGKANTLKEVTFKEESISKLTHYFSTHKLVYYSWIDFLGYIVIEDLIIFIRKTDVDVNVINYKLCCRLNNEGNPKNELLFN